MISRSMSITAAILAAVVCAGCPEENKGGDNKYGAKTGSTAAKTASTGTAATTGTATATAANTAAAKAPEGTGVIKGTVKLAGKPPEMKVPKAREKAELCKDTKVVYNAVVAKDGKLKDVLVAIGDGQIKGEFSAAKAAELHQKDCVYVPRIQGVLAGQEVQIFNDDATMHNVHAYKGAESPLNQGQPKGAPAIKKTFDEPGVYRFQCDVHPWMRAFLVATDNPFNGVSGDDGSFKIERVPAGKYTIVAWHSMYGKLEKKDVEVKDGEVTVDFEYTGKEAEPPENTSELKDLF
jgi:plastocyanin